MIYQMMNGRISKRTLTKMIKAYYMCAQNGVVYKGYTEWTGDKLSYVRKYILCKCADRRIDSKNIDEGCGTDELDIVWLNDSLLLIAEKDAVVQGRMLNRAFYRLSINSMSSSIISTSSLLPSDVLSIFSTTRFPANILSGFKLSKSLLLIIL